MVSNGKPVVSINHHRAAHLLKHWEWTGGPKNRPYIDSDTLNLIQRVIFSCTHLQKKCSSRSPSRHSMMDQTSSSSDSSVLNYFFTQDWMKLTKKCSRMSKWNFYTAPLPENGSSEKWQYSDLPAEHTLGPWPLKVMRMELQLVGVYRLSFTLLSSYCKV